MDNQQEMLLNRVYGIKPWSELVKELLFIKKTNNFYDYLIGTGLGCCLEDYLKICEVFNLY